MSQIIFEEASTAIRRDQSVLVFCSETIILINHRVPSAASDANEKGQGHCPLTAAAAGRAGGRVSENRALAGESGEKGV